MLGDTNIKLLKARINHLLLPKYPKYAGIYIYLVQQLLMGFEQILIFSIKKATVTNEIMIFSTLIDMFSYK